MNGETRRNGIIDTLLLSSAPVSAAALAAKFNVSRQIIVGDVSLLRASGKEIVSTPRGYIMSRDKSGIIKKIVCLHSGKDMENELNIMVDNGCSVLDVIVEHPFYGQLAGKLMLSTRYDVKKFVSDISKKDAPPLSSLTGGIHIHTLSCPDEDAYQRVVNELNSAGYLYSENG
jgi:hypothetical protein